MKMTIGDEGHIHEPIDEGQLRLTLTPSPLILSRVNSPQLAA